MHWFAQAPANIALIKYMGKKDSVSNLPLNASLSYTLNALVSSVSLEVLPQQEDVWEPLIDSKNIPFNLSFEGQKRYLKFAAFLKAEFNYQGGFLIRSGNNFPDSAGLASSASSFAALTKVLCLALSELTQTALPSNEEQAQLSRLGSGSSCRSFYSPWALWQAEEVQPLELPYDQLLHQVIIVNREKKKVSSSKAHQLVQSSPFYSERTKQAEAHLKLLLAALRQKDWVSAYEICWREFQAMHQLFSSCAQAFSYMGQESLWVLEKLQTFWKAQGDGPIVTMDAGPNIHLLYRSDQGALAQLFQRDYLRGRYDVL